MSAQANQELICKALQAGAVDLLMKPIRHNEVVTMWQHVWKSSCMPQGEPCWSLLPISPTLLPVSSAAVAVADVNSEV